MIERDLSSSLQKLCTQVLVISLLGPRQSGKTTLVKQLFPDYTYVNLEDSIARSLAEEDPRGFFARYREPLILDEVQRVPSLLSSLQVLVDQDREKNGRFVLTGSHQPGLQAGLAQSLAGRTTLMHLLPLSMKELAGEELFQNQRLDELLLRGCMPELYRTGTREPGIFYRDYLATYVEKDLRQMMEIRRFDAFQRFLRLLAGRVGQIVN